MELKIILLIFIISFIFGNCDRIENCNNCQIDNYETIDYLRNITKRIRRSNVNTCACLCTIKISNQFCEVENTLENGQIVYSYDNITQVHIGDMIELGSAINYKCDRGYTLIGDSENVCLNGKWTFPSPECKIYCSPITLESISVNANCEYNGLTYPCNLPQPPRAVATLTCKIGYKLPSIPKSPILTCQANGQWFPDVWKCDLNCGTPIPNVIPVLIGGKYNKIQETPWHVAIYSHKNDIYKYICGGTIINTKLILSAAHCFWDIHNSRVFHYSEFVVGAGKTFQYINANDDSQILNITDIIVKNEYLYEAGNHNYDIAILLLEKHLIYTYQILPACIDFTLQHGHKVIRSGLIGTLAGWGRTTPTGATSDILKIINFPSINLHACQDALTDFERFITGDKFCAGYLNGDNICEGDSGGGLVFKQYSGNIETYYIRGVASIAVGKNGKCDPTKYSLFTNINYYSEWIKPYYTSNLFLI